MSAPKPPETPLDKLGGLSPALRGKLQGNWITTVEQVVAQAATPEGRKGLAGLLGLDEGALAALLSEARALLGPDAVRRLEAPHPHDKGLGALKPPC